MINEILLITSALAFIVLIVAMFYIIKLKRFEDERLMDSINILAFSLFFILMFLGINTLDYLNKSFNLTKISTNIPNYIQTLNSINNIALIPLFAICLLAGMMVLKEL